MTNYCFRPEQSSLLWSSSASSLGHRAAVHANGHRDAARNLQMVTFCPGWNRFDSFLMTTTPQIKVLLVPVSSSCSPPINIIKLAALTKKPGYSPKVICRRLSATVHCYWFFIFNPDAGKIRVCVLKLSRSIEYSNRCKVVEIKPV